MLSYKDNQRRLRNPCDPRITDELGIERKQARRRFRVSAGCRLPVDEAAYAVNFADGQTTATLNIPFKGEPHGFYDVVIGMIVIAGFMLGFFRLKRWI